jgi:SAM-dependent methyltransferase
MCPSAVTRGDFTGLAEEYSQNRPDYSGSVLTALIGLTGKPTTEIDFVDIGAGTGIWTRMVHERGVKSAIAVEPNHDMRITGARDSNGTAIRWVSGAAEQTGLLDNSCDWLSMASSFHWVDFEVALAEFSRVLRPHGWFTALWNPRLIEGNLLLQDIEKYLHHLCPPLNRVSSGRSGITVGLTERLLASGPFDDVVYMEGRHTIMMSPERYLGAWRSVNDIQAQLGPYKFDDFLRYVETSVSSASNIATTYLTRAWSARRKKSL